MGNIMDYIEWRGDLPFTQSEFNDVDNLILACFSYVNLDGIPEAASQNGIELKALTEKFLRLHTEKELKEDKSFIRFAPFMMLEMAKTERFGQCVIRNYVNEIVAEEAQQFSAVEICLSDGTSYISFRGTDDTIVGWKEDFNLSTGVVPAQERAVEYLRRIAGSLQEMVRVGGHSKGGNLAVYGAVMCKEIHPWILQVYSNDGPGFSREFLELPETEALLPKVTRIIPEYSIIGTLLEHSKEPVLVASSNKGLLQHDGFSWEVSGNHFASKEQLNSRAETFVSILHKWIDGMDVEQKKVLIEDLFSTIEASGSENLSEIQAGGLKSFTAMLKRIESFAPESREMVQELFLALFGGWLEQLKLPDMEKIPFLPQSFSDKILEKF
jgi:tRNA threonylcarbamoyladenosine modification (KEOPS) complex Cgi121 subunit